MRNRLKFVSFKFLEILISSLIFLYHPVDNADPSTRHRKPIERTLNDIEIKIKRNADDVGTSDTCGTNNKQCWYLHQRQFVLFRVPIYLAFFQLVLRWRVLSHTLSTG